MGIALPPKIGADASTDEAIQAIQQILPSIQGISAKPEQVLNELLLRSGVLRQPAEDRIDFIHRTFQEYLAALASAEKNHIPMLVDHAHLDDWREVVIMVAGVGRQDQRRQLLEGILGRAESSSEHSHRLQLLAVACLESAPELAPELQRKIHECLRNLIPPGNKTEARALSSAGDLAAELLDVGLKAENVLVTAAIIRTLALIGTDKALERLKVHGLDDRVTVTRELIRAWDAFDIIRYAEEVLRCCPLDHGHLTVTDPTLLKGVGVLELLSRLHCHFDGKVISLDDFPTHSQLWSLNLSRCRVVGDPARLSCFENSLRNLQLFRVEGISSLSWVAALKKLQTLGITKPDATTVELDAGLLLPELTELTIVGGQFDRISLDGLPRLKELYIASNKHLRALPNLSAAPSLVSLSLEGCNSISDLSNLPQATKLDSLNIFYCDQITDWSAISECPQLQNLTVRGSKVFPDDFGIVLNDLSWSGGPEIEDLSSCKNTPLSYLSMNSSRIQSLNGVGYPQSLTIASFRYCDELADIRMLSDCKELISLDLEECTSVTDLSALQSLPKLKWLDIDSVEVNDLDVLASLPPLRTLRVRKSQVERLPKLKEDVSIVTVDY